MSQEPPLADPARPADSAPFLRWPPPGLERVQGDVWRVASRGGISALLLVLPLLFAIAREHAFASLGPFGDAWWVALVLSIVGLGFALDAFATTTRIFRRTAEALGRGYDLKTVATVLVDRRRDMGFLLQGGRHFAVVDVRERKAIAGLRIFAASAFAIAALWMPVGLVLGLLLAARGAVGSDGLWMVALLPAAVVYLFGLVAGATEDSRVRRARKKWFEQPWSKDLVVEEVAEWQATMAAHLPDGSSVESQPGRAPVVRSGAVVVAALSVMMAIPILTLVPSAAIGPILASVSMPRFSATLRRAAEAEVLRDYATTPDGSVDPQEAGRLLQTLTYAGVRRDPSRGERMPEVRFDEEWIPPGAGDENPLGVQTHRWPEVAFATAVEGWTPEVRAFVDAAAAHPALPLFGRLAQAPELDAVAGRWPATIADDLTLAELPIPKLSGIREAAQVQLLAAAGALEEGDAQRAERMIREVIAVGLLLGDQGPTLIDNLIGYVIAGWGAEGLRHFFDAVGREEEARRLERAEEVAELIADRITLPTAGGIESAVRVLPDIVLDPDVPRGLGWEFLGLTATLSPCLNLRRMVFGPGEDYEAFLADARDSLVRWPSEEPLFEVVSTGYLGGPAAQPTFLGRVLAVSMNSSPGSCGRIVQSLGELRTVLQLN